MTLGTDAIVGKAGKGRKQVKQFCPRKCCETFAQDFAFKPCVYICVCTYVYCSIRQELHRVADCRPVSSGTKIGDSVSVFKCMRKPSTWLPV